MSTHESRPQEGGSRIDASDSTRNDLIAVAENAYQWMQRGVPAFPIAISFDETKGKTNKRPLTANGHHDATTDPTTLVSALKAARPKPDEVVAVGLLPGQAGFVVFDGDLKADADGPAYIADTLKMPDTFTVDTASGGVHRWYRKRDAGVQISNASPWQANGVDIRGDAGWVVAPGTETSWGSWIHRESTVWPPVAQVPEEHWETLLGDSQAGTSRQGSSRQGPWARYRPEEHQALLDPATVEVLQWLASGAREHPIDIAQAIFRTRAGGEPYLEVTRPGKSGGRSASLGFVGPGVLRVFSTDWPGLAGDKTYDLEALKAVEGLASSGGQSRHQFRHVGQTGETGETGETGVQGPRLWRGSELFESEPTCWLARGLLPFGQVAALIGDEGIGKSLWWVLLVAHITTGKGNELLGIPARKPKDVVLVITEDSWTTDVRPRLEAAGAALSRVHVLAEDADGSGSPTFPRDMARITEAAEDLDIGLIVVDAWLDTVPSGLQVKDAQQSRQALHPWRNAAQQTGASVLLVAHSNRSDEGSLRNRVGATAALRQKVRVLLYAATSPDDGLLYIGPDKVNGAAKANALAYKLQVEQPRVATPDDPGTIARLEVVGDSGSTMDQHYARWRAAERRTAQPNAADRSWEWLLEYATEFGEETTLGLEVKAADAQAAAREAGINPKGLAQVVKDHGGYAGPGGLGGAWIYRLHRQKPPATSQDDQSRQSRQSRQSLQHGETGGETDLLPFEETTHQHGETTPMDADPSSNLGEVTR